MSKKTLMLVGGAALLYFWWKHKNRPVAVARPAAVQSLPTDSMAAATMPGAVQGLITDSTRQVQTAQMQGMFGCYGCL